MSSLYASARQSLLTAGFVWTSAPVYAILVSEDYQPDFEADATMADVPTLALMSAPTLIQGRVSVDGFAHALDVNFGTITTVGAVVAILLKLQPAAAAPTDPLLMYLDQGAGFGVTITNTATSIAWDNAGVWRP